MWCSAGNFRRPSGESPWQLGCWLVYTPGTNTGSGLPTALTRLAARLLGNTGWVFSLSTLSMLSASIPTAPIPGVYLPTDAEHGLPGHMIQYKNPTGTVLEVLWILHFLLPDHAQPGRALGCHYWHISGIQLCQWGPNQAPSAMIYTCICIYSDGECPLSLGCLSTSEKQWITVLYYFSSPWRLPSSWSLLSLTLGSGRLEARLAYVRGMTTCQRLATTLAALILLTHLAF